MRVRRSLAALLVILLGGPCLLSACGGGSTSVADPPVSGSPTSSAPTTQPPAHESPEHFIRRWAAAEKRMENTGRTHAYSVLIDHCRACQSLVGDVKRFYANGGYIRWGGLEVISVKVSSRQPDGRVVYQVKTNSRPTSYRESASGSVKALRGGVTRELVTLERRRGRYLVTARARLSG